jgi:serine/threonine protein kinase
MSDQVGEHLGNYRLLRLLGRGGFATVYLGEHAYLKSLAALKVLHTHLNEEDAAQFIREAQILAGLAHPHIVRVLDFAVQDGMPFLVMEYAPGGTLRQRHPKETLLLLETIVSFVGQTASALQYAHDQRLIHRDVKPENMLLTARDELVLSDFGLALLTPQTLSGSTQAMDQSMAGTTSYTAPEQLQGKPRPASDQYSLGVIVYEWITGKRPFSGSPFEIAMQHLWAVPPPLREQVPDLSPSIEETVLRALAKDPEDRFASVQDFAEALAAAHHAKALPSIPPLHIHLLGDFLLVSGETPVTTVDWPRLQSLLAYLLLHHAAPQSRAHLAYLLWPDSTDAQAHTNLRQLVHRLRHTLPHADRFVRIEKQTLHWQPDTSWTLDVADFERAIAQANAAEQASNRIAERLALEQAAASYRADLLPGCYDEWILPERERLRQLFLGALERLILLLEEAGNSQAAINAAQRLLHHDPLLEATYCHLMRLYAAQGNRAAALRAYHTCVTVLERELGAEPSPATQAAYERLVQKDALPAASVAPATTMAAATPLVGRQYEWERLQLAWQQVLAGEPLLVVLSGEAGIGKTRLAEELLAWRARQGSATASARCYAAEGELVYAPVVAWLRAEDIEPSLSALPNVWLVEVARLVPDISLKRPDLPPPSPLVENWQRQRLFEALARAMLGARQPLLLLLDDLQWCDRETLAWLHYFLRFDKHARVLILGTLRLEEMTSDHPLESLLVTLRRSGQMTEIPLGPLNAAETSSLAAQVAGQDLALDQAADLYQETEGNPLFVVETVRMGMIGARGTQHRSESNRTTSQDAKLPPTVQAVITARLGQLSPQASELVSLAAVIGRAFTFQVLAQVNGGNEDALVGGLDELWQRRIVREQEADAYDFSHDKLREVVYTSLSAARRRLLHRRVAEALETVYADTLDTVSGQIAAHYESAGVADLAVTYYQRAGATAQQIYANAEALAFFQRALLLLETSPLSEARREWRQEMIAHCHERVGDVLDQTGQLDEAKASYQRALAYIPKHELIWQAHLYRQIGWNEMQYEQALQYYDIAEAMLGREPTDSAPAWWGEWIQIQLSRIILYYNWAKLPELVEQIEKVRPVVEQYGTPTQRSTFFIGLARLAWRRDRYRIPEETLQYSQAALAASQESGDLNEIASAWFMLGFSHLWCNHLDQAEKHMQTALTLAERTGDLILQARCLTYLTIVYRKHGLVEKVRWYASKALAVATTLQFHEYIGYAQGNMAWIAWREGNMAEVQQHGQAALESLEQDEPFHWVGLWPLVGLAVGEQQLSNAITYARILLAPLELRLPDALTALLEEAIRAWDSGQPETSRFHLTEAITLAQEMGYL